MKGLKYDKGKPRYTLLPPNALAEVVDVLEHGASKYGVNNYKFVEDAEDRYLNAVYRHLEAIRRGHLYDTETGFSHYAHAATSLLFLIEGMRDEIPVRRPAEEAAEEDRSDQESEPKSSSF